MDFMVRSWGRDLQPDNCGQGPGLTIWMLQKRCCC